MRKPLIHGVGCMVMFLLVMLPAYAVESTANFWTTPFCDFGVAFPAEPREYEMDVQAGPGIPRSNLLGAEIEVDGLYRAECAPMPSEHVADIKRDDYVSNMNAMADNYGLIERTYEVVYLQDYTLAVLTGFRETDRGRMILEITNYMAHGSIFTIYRGQLTRDWQSERMRAFKDSVQILSR